MSVRGESNLTARSDASSSASFRGSLQAWEKRPEPIFWRAPPADNRVNAQWGELPPTVHQIDRIGPKDRVETLILMGEG